MIFRRVVAGVVFCALIAPLIARGGSQRLPDGRTIAPTGFTVPVEGFATNGVLSPDGAYFAVISADGAAVDILDTHESLLAERLVTPSGTDLAWTTDGLFVSRGYTGLISRYTYVPGEKNERPVFTKLLDINAGGPGLLNGIAEDVATHRIAVARTADRSVLAIDNATGATLATLHTSGQPFDVAFIGGDVMAANYNSNRVDLWRHAVEPATSIVTGPHPTRILVDGTQAYVANADGNDVALIDAPTQRVVRHYDLSAMRDQPPGQTPSGMALASDGATLFVCESGFNDVAVVDVRSGKVKARIPTGWYPMAVSYVDRATVASKDPRKKPQLWIVCARGLGEQPDPAGEWNGHMFGLVQHIVVDPTQFARWSTQVARSDRFTLPAATAKGLPPIKHVVFIVVENKHFDEEFGDEPRANADPTLLVYGRRNTPNLHALAERYTLFDDFMGNGDASIYGHSWTVQGATNDYQERNARARGGAALDIAHRVPFSIWPYSERGEDTLTPAEMNADWFTNLADLPGGPRTNASGVFGPRGELIDELQRRNISFRVYGEQLTMTPDGTIAAGLAAHADREYPGTHIDFGILDTDRAQMFVRDLGAHGLAAYTYLTLPVDHTAGSRPGFYTPESFVANNDAGLGTIVSAISKRPEWKSTLIIVSPDDPQGTGDHVDSKRMPVVAIGPYVKRAAVNDTLYSFPSILRTVEVLFGAQPLNIEDATSAPILDAFAATPDVRPYMPLAQTIEMVKNPGKAVSFMVDVDGPESARIPDQEWAAVHGSASLERHHAQLARLGTAPMPVGADATDVKDAPPKLESDLFRIRTQVSTPAAAARQRI